MYTAYNTLEGFLDAKFVRSHSWETKKTYNTCIRKFEQFLKENYECNSLEIIEQIKQDKIDVYQLLRSFVVNQDKLGFMPRTIGVRINAVKEYLRYCGIKIYSEDFKQSVSLPRKYKVVEIPLTKEIILRLLRNVSPKLQVAILVAIASGMRIGELVQIRISDIDFKTKPTTIHLRAETTKTRTPREVFLTDEATQALKDYLKRNHGWNEENNSQVENKPVFGRTSISNNLYKKDEELKTNSVSAAETLLQKSLLRYIKKIPDLNVKNENGKQAIHFHAFRKFFRTTVGNACGRDFAEAIIGHGFYLDTYYNLPEEKKKELYLKAEPELTISDYQEVAKTFAKLSEKHDYLSNKVDGMLDYFKTQGVKVPESLLP